MWEGKCVVLGVTGGIAAYKACDLVSRLKKLGIDIRVIMTKGATQFVQPLTFESLSGNPVAVDLFDTPSHWEIEHIAWAKKADVFVVAPASANFIGKVANGIADDMLTTTVMATKAPVLIAPAMNTNMYLNPIVQDNMTKLKAYGYHFISPESGRLACNDLGIGKLVNNDDLMDALLTLLENKKDLSGQNVLITAGGTKEAIDPVRYITNHSSGKMAYAIAKNCLLRGAEVKLITSSSLRAPYGVSAVMVDSAEAMFKAVDEAYNQANYVVFAAAVADYTPTEPAEQKRKKDAEFLELTLKKTQDIAYHFGQLKKEAFHVGFSAETENLLTYAQGKLDKKNLDMIVANDVSATDSGFHVDHNRVTILDRRGGQLDIPLKSKEKVAEDIVDYMVRLSGK
jgi:phosphopantothenoylcysteine decarboxylase/phosphopantothenate--cysteine ligase